MENPAGIAKFSVMKKTSSRRNGSLAGKKFLAVIRIGYIKLNSDQLSGYCSGTGCSGNGVGAGTGVGSWTLG